MFTIKSTAQMTDLNAHTIRAWERRYKALEPRRHENGRRLYTREDVERLKLLSKLVQNGHSISSIATLSTQILESMQKQTSESAVSVERETETSVTSPPKTPRASAAQRSAEGATTLVLSDCLNALAKYDLVLINSELESARLLFSAKQFVLQLGLPLIKEVGRMVSDGRFSVAQEHALSAMLRSQMMQILFNIRNSLALRSFTRKDLRHGKSIAIATQEGDLHEFGILSAAIIAAFHGHIPHYFGPNMPVKGLIDAAHAIQADLVIVGATYIPDAYRVMSDLQYAKTLEKELHSKVEVWWGGYADLSREFLESHPRQKLFSSLIQMDENLSRINLQSNSGELTPPSSDVNTRH